MDRQALWGSHRPRMQSSLRSLENNAQYCPPATSSALPGQGFRVSWSQGQRSWRRVGCPERATGGCEQRSKHSQPAVTGVMERDKHPASPLASSVLNQEAGRASLDPQTPALFCQPSQAHRTVTQPPCHFFTPLKRNLCTGVHAERTLSDTVFSRPELLLDIKGSCQGS